MGKIIITGANGFIGKHLWSGLMHRDTLISYDIENNREFLRNHLKDATFIFHLAGVNYPPKEEYFNDNFELTQFIIDCLIEFKNFIPIVLTSSTQAVLDNPYGRSKLEAEKRILKYRKAGGVGYIYRLSNVFGPGCRPNYNSVVSTWSYNIINGKEIVISDRNKQVEFIYIDDLINEFKEVLNGNRSKTDILSVHPSYKLTLGKLADTIRIFHSDLFRKLYTTYSQFL